MENSVNRKIRATFRSRSFPQFHSPASFRRKFLKTKNKRQQQRKQTESNRRTKNIQETKTIKNLTQRLSPTPIQFATSLAGDCVPPAAIGPVRMRQIVCSAQPTAPPHAPGYKTSPQRVRMEAGCRELKAVGNFLKVPTSWS